jgi:rod shape-determining protein MreC
MIALTRQGSLIGTVTEVLDDVAWVTLISDPTSAVSATVQASKVQGIVAGSTDGTLTMEFVDRTADVTKGDLVVTSAVGGSYPPGELVGEVVDVEQTPQELFKSVTVQPLADLSHIESVIVLTSFEPAPAPPSQP